MKKALALLLCLLLVFTLCPSASAAALSRSLSPAFTTRAIRSYFRLLYSFFLSVCVFAMLSGLLSAHIRARGDHIILCIVVQLFNTFLT